jgi:pimeloyl-ACP methyl ester carboxylesterase/uncharacterized tellurite resistance protein B-like protein
MQEKEIRNAIYRGAEKRDALYDLTIPEAYKGELIIFLHGFMGFKDWGCWNLVSDFFTSQGFAFLKYNGTHNGTSIESPTDFVDLHAFSKNTYSKEVEDLEAILNLVEESFSSPPVINLIGHSRGGGIALLFSHDARISRIISLAGISSIAQRFPKGEELENWKNNDLRHIHNARTGQDLPLSYVQFEEYQQNSKRLNIEYYCRTSSKPTLIIHGEQDEAVSISEGEQIAEWTLAEFVRLATAGHTFGASHPWHDPLLPNELREVCLACIRFINVPINHEKNQNVSAIVELIKLAKVDNNFVKHEFEFIHTLAKMMGMSTDDFQELFNRYIEFTPPSLEFDRILQFQRLILLMNIDGKMSPEEIEHVQNLALRMGLNPHATDELIRYLKENPNKLISPDKLLQLFKLHHN